MGSFATFVQNLAMSRPGAKPKAVRPPWETVSQRQSKINYEGMNVYWAEYRQESLVRECMNLIAYFTVHTGYRVAVTSGAKRNNDKMTKFIEQFVKDINLEDALFVAVIGKMIWGHFGFEIVRNGGGEIVQLLPLLPPDRLKAKFDENNVLVGFEFEPEGSSEKIPYEPEEVLYFVETSIDNNMEGLSRIEPILTACEIKRELFSDMAEAAKRLWAPIGVFHMDTRGTDSPEEADKALVNFASQIEPGKPVVTNSTVEGDFFNAMPDVDRIVRALEKVDEEIMGNFGIPKALLAREKSMNRATLEYSLQALYQSQIEGLQQYLSREIEQQLLDLVKEEMLGNSGKNIKIELKWNPRTSLEMDEQFGPAISLYALGLIDLEYLYDLLSLDKNRIPSQDPQVAFDPETLRAVLSFSKSGEADDMIGKIEEVVNQARSETDAIP